MSSPTFIILNDNPDLERFWSPDRYQELRRGIMTEIDEAKQMPLIKEASLIMLRYVKFLPTNAIAMGHYWWPWIRNYYGERSITDGDPMKLFAFVWLDQKMKKSMGY